MKRSIFWCFYLSLLTTLLASAVQASSCCVGGGGQSICVLPYELNYQIALANSYRKVDGDFDPYGYYSKYKNGDGETILVSTLGAAYRLNPTWQMGASIPVVHNRYSVGRKKTKATNIGDPVIETRYTLWEDLSFLTFRPAVSFYGGVRFPLGRSTYESKDPLESDVTGEGFFTPHIGVTLSKLYRPIQLALDGTFFSPFSKDIDQVQGKRLDDPYTLRPGKSLQLVESITYLPHPSWSASVGFRQLWKFKSSVDGKAVNGSAARSYWTLIGANYFYSQNWSIGANFETAAPFYRYFANQSNSYVASASFIYSGL